MTLLERIQQHEGTGPTKGGRFFPYVDTTGHVSIGWGRNLTGKGISRAFAEQLLEEDLDEAVAGAATFPWFASLDAVRQEVIVEMVFNLGLEKLRKFKATLAAVAAGDYTTASIRMLESRWRQQVGQRAVTLAAMMRTGVAIT